MRQPVRQRHELELGLLGTSIAVVAWGSSGVIVKAIDMVELIE